VVSRAPWPSKAWMVGHSEAIPAPTLTTTAIRATMFSTRGCNQQKSFSQLCHVSASSCWASVYMPCTRHRPIFDFQANCAYRFFSELRIFSVAEYSDSRRLHQFAVLFSDQPKGPPCRWFHAGLMTAFRVSPRDAPSAAPSIPIRSP